MAQLVAHLNGIEGVSGSSPLSSTKFLKIDWNLSPSPSPQAERGTGTGSWG
jgi:hypothetical protein